MPYLDTNARTTRPTSNEKLETLGRMPVLHGIFVGYVKDSADVLKNGRLRVWIPELGSAPDEQQGWITVNYCSPFAGATNNQSTNRGNTQSFEGTQTSYGMWMIPPDVNVQVVVMFVNGDSTRGIWMGALYDQFMNNMVPGMAASADNHQYNGKEIPVAEYNKWDEKIKPGLVNTSPYEKTKFQGLGNQGLITDKKRGTTTSSARRESPSNVFGILTPGPVIDTAAAPEDIRRKGGSSFIMDDGTDSEYVQLATKTGAQVRIDETNGFVYLINRDGTAWVQMDQFGNIDIFGAVDISMRAQRDINLRADRNVNIEAGQNVFIKAAQDTNETTTTFTYDINNVPKPSTIPYFQYVGEGKGQGGSIVMQALNSWHSTAKNSAYLTVIDNNMNVCVGNSFSLTTQNGGQDYNSKKGIKMTTDAAFDFAATGNIRIGSNGSISVVGKGDIIFCTEANLSLNATGNIVETAGSAYSLDAVSVGIGTSVSVNGNIDLTATITAGTVIGTFTVGGPGSGPSVLNPIQSEAALSAAVSPKAEIKPMNDKTNILATWDDPESKFKRNSEKVKTTVSRLTTYEPCPEHETFIASSVAGNQVALTEDDKTYAGSSGAGNDATVVPPAPVSPGANNTSVMPDPDANNNFAKDMNLVTLRCQLEYHEGVKFKSYFDTSGLLHGGIGHLLRANEVSMYPSGTPIEKAQVDLWYTQDSASAIKIAQDLIGSTWADLSDVRKRAVTDLAYNLGRAKLAKFKIFLSSMRVKEFNRAGAELRSSAWFGQVGRRGPNIVAMIVQDIDPVVWCS